jgi:hypothetical protein
VYRCPVNKEVLIHTQEQQDWYQTFVSMGMVHLGPRISFWREHCGGSPFWTAGKRRVRGMKVKTMRHELLIRDGDCVGVDEGQEPEMLERGGLAMTRFLDA